MTDLMERTRVTFELPEPVRRAIAIYAAEQNLSVGEVVSWMSQALIPAYIEQAERALASGERSPKKRGRPPKS